jgi:hypothetical protein
MADADHASSPAPAAFETTYRRAPRALWRQGPDRILTRLVGVSALVWVALDGPRRGNHLTDELAEFTDSPTIDRALADMIVRRLVEVIR